VTYIEKAFAKCSLAQRESIPLMSDDSSGLLFVSAAINAVRKPMLASDHLDECFVIQSCFRYHEGHAAPFNFTMLGLFGGDEYSESLIAKLFSLLDGLGFDRKRVFSVVNSSDRIKQ